MTDYTPDPSVRIHMAAHDPDFPRKREVAMGVISAAIDVVAAPLGYTCTGTTWARRSGRGKTAVHLQRSHYGYEARISLRYLPADDIDLTGTVWLQEDDIGLDLFTPPGDPTPMPGVIFYLDAHDDPASLRPHMDILRDRALPWLDAHHLGLPLIDAYPAG